ncbi:MAG: LacI family DNA-binding transcriptional regulator [Planctomycetota bacterium]|jgi:LacI family transcriptional regulator|nr:LacI family DNA-binding transcriptional regulator [Planctomycetota bacterium]
MVKLIDVANKAGVSKATASRVLNGQAEQHRIAAATADRVRRAARDLGYQPSSLARALSAGATDTVGLICQSTNFTGNAQTLFSELLAGVSASVRGAGKHLLLPSETGRWESLGLTGWLAKNCEALVGWSYICTPGFTDLDLNSLTVPLVLVMEPMHRTDLPLVLADPAPGICTAIDRLVELGHRRFAWVGVSGQIGDTIEMQRFAIAKRHLFRTHDLEVEFLAATDSPPPGHLRPGAYIAAHAARMHQLVPEFLKYTALLCHNDVMAVAVQRLLQQAGRAVPAQHSVVGIDGLYADMGSPAVSSVVMPFQELGSAAGNLAIELARLNADARREYHGFRLSLPAAEIRGATIAAAPVDQP